MDLKTEIPAPKPPPPYVKDYIHSRLTSLSDTVEHIAYLAEQAGRMQAHESMEAYRARRADIHQRINIIVANMSEDMMWLWQVTGHKSEV